jgi:hypothetical protein
MLKNDLVSKQRKNIDALEKSCNESAKELAESFKNGKKFSNYF